MMWRVVYRELRALTNDAVMNLNSMELNEVYEDVWNVGSLLQSDDALSILQPDYRPWPKVKDGTDASREFYNVHDRDKEVTPLTTSLLQRTSLHLFPTTISYFSTHSQPEPDHRLILRSFGRTKRGQT
jgi:hypothetical protein